MGHGHTLLEVTVPQSLTPFRGAPHTVAAIRQAAMDSQTHYELRQLAESVVSGLRDKDYLSESLAVYQFVWANTRYTRDPRTLELVRAPHLVAQALLRGEKPCLDCDDMTALIAALLLTLGFQVRVATVAFKDMFYRGERQYSHVFVQGFEPRSGSWITLDPVAGITTNEMLRKAVAVKLWAIA